MEDILIDTDIVIEYLRSKEKSSTELIKLLQKYDVLLSSISEFELYLVQKRNAIRMIWRCFSVKWRSYLSISDVAE